MTENFVPSKQEATNKETGEKFIVSQILKKPLRNPDAVGWIETIAFFESGYSDIELPDNVSLSDAVKFIENAPSSLIKKAVGGFRVYSRDFNTYVNIVF